MDKVQYNEFNPSKAESSAYIKDTEHRNYAINGGVGLVVHRFGITHYGHAKNRTVTAYGSLFDSYPNVNLNGYKGGWIKVSYNGTYKIPLEKLYK